MSKTEILQELPTLTSPERAEILDRLLLLDEEDGPTLPERQGLDEAQAAFDADQNPGTPWREVIARLHGER